LLKLITRVKGKGPRRYSETEDDFKPEESEEETAGLVFSSYNFLCH
jgi:hypothetical protein